MASWGTNVPQPSGEPPYPSPLAMEGREGEGRTLGAGEGSPWEPHAWGEQGGPQWPPSVEEKGSYGASITESRGGPWLPPEEEKGATWGPTDGDPRGPPWESWPAEGEGRVGSWEPPQKRPGSPPVGGWLRVPLSPPREDSWEPPAKRVRSPPMDKWQRVPLSPPRERAWTSPDSQGQTSGSSSHATQWEPRSKSSGRDSHEKVGSPWVSQSRWDGPTTQSMGSSLESPVPANTWESCCDPVTLQPASGRATEERDPEEPDVSSSSSSRGDPVWETRQGNPVDGSYSVKTGGSKASWSERGFQSFQSQADNREWDNRGLKGQQDEGWARDEGLKEPLISKQDRGRPVEFPRESIPRRGQGSFSGPKDHPERYKGPGTQAVTHRTWLPRAELVEYWTRCHHVMRRKVRNKFLFFCPRPFIPDRSSEPPAVNPELDLLIGRHAMQAMEFSLLTQREVLDMLGATMALYEMTEAAIERQEEVEALVVRKLARCLLSFARSANRRLTLQRCLHVLQGIDPRLMPIISKLSGRNPGGLLFMEKEVNFLKGLMRSLPELPEVPPEVNFSDAQEAGRTQLIAPPLELPPPVEDEAAPLYEQNSDQEAPLQNCTSLKRWHRRFGHADPAAILRLQKGKLATGIQVGPGEASSAASCVTCLTEQGHKAPFSLNVVRSSTALMELIQCELSGPFNVPSLVLQRYVLIFVDDFSRFCMTFLLKETGEIHGCFEQYLATLCEKHKWKPKAFQMNSAADAVSPQTHAFLEARGIAHKRGVERIPGQSRTAEKEMKSLLEMTRCMLADAKLPEPFWGHAILTATYLWNLVAVSRKGKTPFRDWHGHVPDVNHLRVFGSLVRDRLGPYNPAQQVFVGYGARETNYRVMNLETGVLCTKSTLDFSERKGGKKRGRVLDAIERDGCKVELFTGQNVSMTPQPPERYPTLPSAVTRAETNMPGDGDRGEGLEEPIEASMPQCGPASAAGHASQPATSWPANGPANWPVGEAQFFPPPPLPWDFSGNW